MAQKLYGFSVIIPAFNEEYYIGKCIKSLKEQDYEGEFEIIVVDNGSTDGTRRVVESFGVKVVEEKKRGISFATNAGVKAATGEIFAFSDADTILPPDWLSKINKIFNSDEKIIAVGGPHLFYDANIFVNLFFKRVILPVFKLLNKDIVYLAASNMAVKKEFYLAAGGFNNDIYWLQDTELTKRLNNSGKVIFDYKLFVRTSFRRYRQGHVNVLLASFHAVKEMFTYIYMFHRFTKTNKMFLAQCPVREKEITLFKRFIMNLGTFGAIFLAILLYGLISTSSQVFGKSIHRGQGNNKLVALTFDDGPYGEATIKILDILKEKNVKATFFVTGINSEKYPEILKREFDEGEVIGNHSFDHSKVLFLESPKAIKNNILKNDEVIFKIIGHHPRFFRPPYGLKSPQLIKTLNNAGYKVVLWNDATDDYDKNDSAGDITANILKKVKPGVIIDLHDGRDVQINYPRENLVDALPNIIDKIRAKGYELVTIDKIINEKPYF